jgi:hypothetical protein
VAPFLNSTGSSCAKNFFDLLREKRACFVLFDMYLIREEDAIGLLRKAAGVFMNLVMEFDTGNACLKS